MSRCRLLSHSKFIEDTWPTNTTNHLIHNLRLGRPYPKLIFLSLHWPIIWRISSTTSYVTLTSRIILWSCRSSSTYITLASWIIFRTCRSSSSNVTPTPWLWIILWYLWSAPSTSYISLSTWIILGSLGSASCSIILASWIVLWTVRSTTTSTSRTTSWITPYKIINCM